MYPGGRPEAVDPPAPRRTDSRLTMTVPAAPAHAAAGSVPARKMSSSHPDLFLGGGLVRWPDLGELFASASVKPLDAPLDPGPRRLRARLQQLHRRYAAHNARHINDNNHRPI